MGTLELVYKTSAYIRQLYNSNPRPDFKYHNLAHVEEVVQRASYIAGHYALPENEFLALILAAWFHDVGYLFANQENHEEKSAEMAAEFLQKELLAPELINMIQKTIRATKMPQNPATQIEKILCDADLYHLGTEDFENTDKQVKAETELRINQLIADDVWSDISLKLMEIHQYHTDFCQNLLASGKHENLEKLRQQTIAYQEAPPENPQLELLSAPAQSKKKKDKAKKSNRGVQTMFRINAANQMRLSDMADNKAHILLTINSVIISVLISFIFRKLETESKLLIPALSFLVTSLVTLVSAIMVTRPKINRDPFNSEDVKNRKVNLLFFGSFHSVKYEDYEAGMKEMIKDKDYLQSSMIRDNYNLGKVLERKYRKLHFAYGFFMFGFVISVISFIVAELLF
ncbi:MAG: phosphohydrolase [Cytophagales bacterium CG18_big_fil_WC_8_21_14_2_50_42_9]|nr:MAG: phosphohydrolase [Cytophagales bacterium CG18_big_fil_WC_8_21_14_2_50_42_9]